MKIRTGFVSNSSSSSFILIVSKNGFDMALSTFDENLRPVIKALFSEETVLGIPAMIHSSWSDNGGSSLEYSDVRELLFDEEGEEEVYIGDVFHDFEDHLIKTVGEDNIFAHSEDW